MSTFENEAQALAALEASFIEDGTETDPLRIREAEIRAEQAAAKGGAEGSTTEESFTRTDPNTLPDDLKSVYKQMQADYTRKTQELAAERKAYAQLDEFGGLEAASQAVQFASALANDPQYALQVHAQLTDALTKAGMTVSEAASQAQQTIQQAVEADQAFNAEDSLYADDPLVQRLNKQLEEQNQVLNELRSWKQTQEQQAQAQALQNQMQLQENQILKENPDYGQSELEHIYKLAYSTGGDLLKANAEYEQIRNALLGSYIEQKGSIVPGVSAGNGEVLQQAEEVKFEGLFDPRLTALVNERLAQEAASEN